MSSTRPVLARALLTFSVVVWGFTFVATKVCLAVLGPLELIGARFLLAVPVLYLLARLRGGRVDFRGHRRALVLGGLFLLLHFVVQVTGLVYTTATNTAWIIAVIPLVMAVCARIFLGERLSRAGWLGIGLATLGVVILVSGGRVESLLSRAALGDGLVLLSAFTWSGYTIVTRDWTRSADSLSVTALVTTPLALVGLPFVLKVDVEVWLGATVEFFVALAFLSFVGTALAHWFWQRGVAELGAARAGLFLYLEPLATTALAGWYLAEPFTAFTAAGGLLVLAGVYLSERVKFGFVDS